MGMGDESNKEAEPNTSKKDSQNENSDHDTREKNPNDPGSECSWSLTSYSGVSGLDMARVRADVPKPIGKKEMKTVDRKSRRRSRPEKHRHGKVNKRKRSETRRQLVHRVQKRRPKVTRKRDLSVSTIFTRLSPGSRRSRSPGCKFCGHRCCLRRYNKKKKRVRFKKEVKKRITKKGKRNRVSEGIQAGSRCEMLSPLFVKYSGIPSRLPNAECSRNFTEISPQMIFDSLERLTKWKHAVVTVSILKYMAHNYPVNRDMGQLLKELKEKLRVAALAGIDCWCLSSELEDTKLTQNHVSLFWKIYMDTMKPFSKRSAV
ncbi:uncharacterized protein LOC101742425 isoform X2 [Bombyx mori]|uniref:uncharacterized protein LOC101742425 isoform X2 n=1 Tax=Bombyx mori TaxID=7091 RepID=UPI002ED6624E